MRYVKIYASSKTRTPLDGYGRGFGSERIGAIPRRITSI